MKQKNEEINVEKIIMDRIKDNQKLFTREELTFINKHANIIKIVYILALIDNK